MYTQNELVINWEDDVKIYVTYQTDKDSDELNGWVVNTWWIDVLEVYGVKLALPSLIQYLYDTMSEKHRDYIQTACEEDRAAHLDQKWS